ncbi:hypothetical protein IQ16_05978 [Bradyrhizobium huanghuaihaiense]|uniref:Uncharacterized protein n=1 Tax=Bradyrhizobium huanghuaihaiense TaxID=990078 RepID=A0A562R5H6_9BRAD|nr:hypothetical protein IQ16_05978 [Bradyrhizobium huanghuaihaiense]
MERERNPGSSAANAIVPDCASLHPGYELSGPAPRDRVCARKSKEYLAGGPAPDSHHLLVGGTVVEVNCLLWHVEILPAR